MRNRAIQKPQKKKLPDVITFRPGDVKPLLEEWIERNPGKTLSWLINFSLVSKLKQWRRPS